MFNICNLKKVLSCFVILVIIIPMSVHARALTVSGTINNLESGSRGGNVRIYATGYPFFGDDVSKAWAMLGVARYNSVDGSYSITIDIPNTGANLVVAARSGPHP